MQKSDSAWLVSCLLGLILLMAGVWGFERWVQNKMLSSLEASPYHQVSNRELSLFLWQHTEMMRANVRYKSSYLPGFDYKSRVGIQVGKAEDRAIAPPELLHRYQLWKEVLAGYAFGREMSGSELMDFLEDFPEWHAEAWPEAPQEYGQLLARLAEMGPNADERIRVPREVQEAFLGWRNYRDDGEKINAANYTVGELNDFLADYPGYTRRYWRLVLAETQPNYLAILDQEDVPADRVVPKEQISSFLRVALYNLNSR